MVWLSQWLEEPTSAGRPALSVTTRSARRKLLNLCATMKVVRPGHQAVQRLLHHGLARRVERAGRLVEDQHARFPDERPRDGDALALAAAEARRRVSPEGRVEAAAAAAR